MPRAKLSWSVGDLFFAATVTYLMYAGKFAPAIVIMMVLILIEIARIRRLLSESRKQDADQTHGEN